jgi:hypothetical protein
MAYCGVEFTAVASAEGASWKWESRACAAPEGLFLSAMCSRMSCATAVAGS